MGETRRAFPEPEIIRQHIRPAESRILLQRPQTLGTGMMSFQRLLTFSVLLSSSWAREDGHKRGGLNDRPKGPEAPIVVPGHYIVEFDPVSKPSLYAALAIDH
jgi:hypothetical protein